MHSQRNFPKKLARCVQAYNMLICGHAQAGDIGAATATLEAMALKGLVPNRESYNAVISCLCRAGEARQAQKVVEMATRRGIALDEWAWSAVVQVRALRATDFFLCVRAHMHDVYACTCT